MYLEAKKAGESQEVKTRTPKQVLLDAADLIEREGWCRYRYYSEGARCIRGAIYAVQSAADGINFVEPDDPRFLAEEAFWEITGATPILWNDYFGGTKEDVVAMLRMVAAQTGGG